MFILLTCFGKLLSELWPFILSSFPALGGPPSQALCGYLTSIFQRAECSCFHTHSPASAGIDVRKQLPLPPPKSFSLD